jgi:hypothetical protein
VNIAITEIALKFSASGIKGNFIQVHVKERDFFPSESFTLSYNENKIKLNVNKAYRIVSKHLFRILQPNVDEKIIIKKDSDSNYTILLNE